jgi:hypothetical protein
MSRKRRPRPPGEFPRFDSAASFKAGLEILRDARVPFALAGRLAVWTYVPLQGQQFTKDVDFAVPHGHIDRALRAARKRGWRPTELDIGGFGIHGRGVAVDFIDRHPHLSGLFADAVRAARRSGKRLKLPLGPVPVVPRDYLIAMKLVTCQPADERDAEELVRKVPARGYPRLRKLVMKELGFLGAQRLDALAGRAGHPGPGARRRRYAARRRKG